MTPYQEVLCYVDSLIRDNHRRQPLDGLWLCNIDDISLPEQREFTHLFLNYISSDRNSTWEWLLESKDCNKIHELFLNCMGTEFKKENFIDFNYELIKCAVDYFKPRLAALLEERISIVQGEYDEERKNGLL